MKEVIYKPIGVVHSPFNMPHDVPIQSAAAKEVVGSVEVYQEYVEGLKDVEGFSHLILVYHFHLECFLLARLHDQILLECRLCV